LAGLHKPPALVVEQGRARDADEMQGAGLDFLKKFARAAAPDLSRLGRARKQIQPVQLFPEFLRQLVAHHPGVLARQTDGRNN
jgi:hypothetical protein